MEKISALMDGELEGPEADRALQIFKENKDARDVWDASHLLRDVLRGEIAPHFDIAGRVTLALEHEPVVFAPRQIARKNRTWTYALSAAASLSAVAFVGWTAFSANSPVAPPVEIAQITAPVVLPATEAELVSSPSDAGMNEYLLAHQGFSPSTTLHGVAPYVRTISVNPASGR